MLGRRVLVILVFAGTLLYAVGCGGADKPSFTVKNESGALIEHLTIMEAGPVLNFAKLDHNDRLTRGFTAEEMPRTIKVYWEDSEGKYHQSVVELWKHLPSSYRGGVKLTLNRNMTIRVSRA